jgi:hypothetical protein
VVEVRYDGNDMLIDALHYHADKLVDSTTDKAVLLSWLKESP